MLVRLMRLLHLLILSAIGTTSGRASAVFVSSVVNSMLWEMAKREYLYSPTRVAATISCNQPETN